MTPRPLSQLALTASRWPPAAALVGLLIVGATLPEKYGLLPAWASWPMWSLVVVLVALSTFAHAHRVLRRLEGLVTAALLVVVTALMIFAIARLVWLVLAQGSVVRGLPLLQTGVSMWLTNLVVFSLWYWLLDRGGPERRLRKEPGRTELLFPQSSVEGVPRGWMPEFFDYVFVAFNTSVSFNANETVPVSSRAKSLMMLQATLSLVTILIVVARAINLLD
jgi:hypothetical protein